MKILKIILGLVVGLALVFFAVGIFAPSFTYENKVEVNASVEKAWAIFTDESRMGDWLTGFQSMETISGNPGEVGSKTEWSFVENGDVDYLGHRNQLAEGLKVSFEIEKSPKGQKAIKVRTPDATTL